MKQDVEAKKYKDFVVKAHQCKDMTVLTAFFVLNCIELPRSAEKLQNKLTFSTLKVIETACTSLGKASAYVLCQNSPA